MANYGAAVFARAKTGKSLFVKGEKKVLGSGLRAKGKGEKRRAKSEKRRARGVGV